MAKFKAGDKARVISLGGSMNGFDIGETVTVVGRGISSQYEILGSSGYYEGYADDRHLEPIEDTPQFNVGDTVVIDGIEEITLGYRYWSDGEITEVTSIDSDGDLYLLSKALGGAEFIVLKSEFHAIRKINGDSHADLRQEIEELKRRVAKLEAEEDSDFNDSFDAVSYAVQTIKSPNELRKEAIESAKKFVEDTEEQAKSPYSIEGGDNHYAKNYRMISEYIVDEDKRTVVALIRFNKDSRGRILTKGIAKCAPDDVFNADIGKAIALGRAYGLDVKDFEMAPQPTEAEVGQFVEIRGNFGREFTTNVGNSSMTHSSVDNLRTSDRLIRIISDTEAKY